MVAVPGLIPYNIPALSTDAIEAALVVQPPTPVGSVKVVVEPWQIVVVPTIGAGSILMVIVTATAQPLGIV